MQILLQNKQPAMSMKGNTMTTAAKPKKRTPLQVRLSRTPAQNVQADLVATHRAKGNSTRALSLPRVKKWKARDSQGKFA